MKLRTLGAPLLASLFLSPISLRAQEAAPAPSSTPSATAEVPPAQPTPAAVQKTIWVANLIRRTSEKNRIVDLEITDYRLPVYLVPKERELRPTISVAGRLLRSGWKLLAQGQPMTLDPKTNSFEIPMHLRSRINECTLTALGPNGEKQVETLYIYAPDAMEFGVVSPWDHIVLSAAPVFMIYQQTGYGEYQSIAAEISLRYTTPDKSRTDKWTDRLGFFGNVDATLFTLASSPVERGPQLLEIKGDASWRLDQDPSHRWQLHLLAGLNYLTMFSNGSSFGFSHLTAPEFGIRARKTIDTTTAWFGDVHYVALGMPLSQQGINIQGGWTRMIRDSRRVEFSIGYTGYAWKPSQSESIQIHELLFKSGISF